MTGTGDLGNVADGGALAMYCIHDYSISYL